jgi:hypothetical protein
VVAVDAVPPCRGPMNLCDVELARRTAAMAVALTNLSRQRRCGHQASHKRQKKDQEWARERASHGTYVLSGVGCRGIGDMCPIHQPFWATVRAVRHYGRASIVGVWQREGSSRPNSAAPAKVERSGTCRSSHTWRRPPAVPASSCRERPFKVRLAQRWGGFESQCRRAVAPSASASGLITGLISSPQPERKWGVADAGASERRLLENTERC